VLKQPSDQKGTEKVLKKHKTSRSVAKPKMPVLRHSPVTGATCKFDIDDLNLQGKAPTW
jgi:hypothetical protein